MGRRAAVLLLMLGAVLAAPASGGFGATTGGAGPAYRVAINGFERSLLAELNNVRRAHGLVPLRLSPPLGAAADAHSRAMGRHGFFAHESRDGSPFSARIRRYYAPQGGMWSIGENLLWGSRGIDAKQSVSTWMQSPGHRRNILTPEWREIGVSAVTFPAAPGVFAGADVVIITTDFGVR